MNTSLIVAALPPPWLWPIKDEIPSRKYEIPNNIQIQNFNFQIVWFEIRYLVFGIYLEFGASGLMFSS
jgi:hypothetical protein